MVKITEMTIYYLLRRNASMTSKDRKNFNSLGRGKIIEGGK
tara:strand:+ start:857 stop:979 length:123 start_codon:yes stop_codon:yes gene_type:complete